MALPKGLKKTLLAIDGVVMVLLGVLFFLTMAGFYIFRRWDLGWLWSLVIVGTILFTLLLVFSGIALVKRKRHGGTISVLIFVLGIAGTLSSYVMARDFKVLAAFFFYVILLAFLLVGWKELK